MADDNDLSPMDQLRLQTEQVKLQAQEQQIVQNKEVQQAPTDYKSQAEQIGKALQEQGVESKNNIPDEITPEIQEPGKESETIQKSENSQAQGIDAQLSEDVKAQINEIGQTLKQNGVEQKEMTQANELGFYAVHETPGVEEKSLIHDHYNQQPPEAEQYVQAERANQTNNLQDKIKQETPEPQPQPEPTQEPTQEPDR